jgi:predicted tellurium resistance membrane protein TerC
VTKKVTLWGTIGTIMLMDVIFSLDSVITAVAMVNNIPTMVAAIVIAMIIMISMVNIISNFVSKHPTVKNLALSFLLMIGFTLIVGAIGVEIPKAFIYVAMGFSIFVETINIRMGARKQVQQ